MGTTSAKSVHKFRCRLRIYMSTEQEREYTLFCHACNRVHNTAKDVNTSDLVSVRDAQAVHSHGEGYDDHTGADKLPCEN